MADASVAARWFLASVPEEIGSQAALKILADCVEGALQLHQSPHFVAEMAGILARLKPATAMLDVRDLLEIGFERVEDEEIYARATDLALTLRHHGFDTLYHAVALSRASATLVTADQGYYRKARHLGQVSLLADWNRA